MAIGINSNEQKILPWEFVFLQTYRGINFCRSLINAFYQPFFWYSQSYETQRIFKYRSQFFLSYQYIAAKAFWSVLILSRVLRYWILMWVFFYRFKSLICVSFTFISVKGRLNFFSVNHLVLGFCLITRIAHFRFQTSTRMYLILLLVAIY